MIIKHAFDLERLLTLGTKAAPYITGLGAAAGIYSLSGLLDKKRKHRLKRAVAGLALGTAAGYGAHKLLEKYPGILNKVISKATRGDKEADARAGETLVANAARAMRTSSVAAGGGGNSRFNEAHKNLKDYIMTKALEALPGGSENGYFGYELRVKPTEAGENFIVESVPKPGYRGPYMWMDKSEKIQTGSLLKKQTGTETSLQHLQQIVWLPMIRIHIIDH